jgi:hypothetical protein
MSSEQEFNGRFAGGEDLLRAGVKDHPVRNGSMARSDQSTRSLQFNSADPARPGWNKIFVVAECWDVDPGIFRSLKNRHSRGTFHVPVIDLDF